MASVADIKKHVSALLAAVKAEDEAVILEELRTLKEVVEPGEEMLRATKAGVAVGKLRTHDNVDISDLAKSIVRKWKEAVEESKKRKAESQDGEESAKKKAKGEASGSASPKKVTASMKRTDSSTSDSSARPVAPLPTKTDASTQDGKPSSSTATSAKKEAKTESADDGPSEASEVNPALPTIVLPYPLKVRTYASDKAANAGTGDSIRDKSVELIYTSLAGDSRADRAVLLEKAKLVEKGFYNAVGTKTDDAYRSKIRGVILNLKDKTNPALRDGIVRGEISAIDICNMSKEDMASENLQALNKQLETENLFNSRGAVEIAAETDQFKCGKCGHRKTTYYQMQTRSADEPMTTFVTCLHCNNRWKFS